MTCKKCGQIAAVDTDPCKPFLLIPRAHYTVPAAVQTNLSIIICILACILSCELKCRSFGPFKPSVELTVGRIAMVGFSGLVLVETILRGNTALF